jgi:uncharacterized protein YbjT (DUF2867 family)
LYNQTSFGGVDMRVLIVGATGVLGGKAAALLLRQGHQVRGMTRSERGVADLASRGIEPVVGDLTDRASLVRACVDVDGLLAAAHAAIERGRFRSQAVDGAGHVDLIDVAQGSGVSRFVYVSAMGARPDHPIDFFRTKWRVEQHLARSALAHAILRPSAFMEWHAHEFNGKAVLAKGRTVLLGDGTKRRNFIAAGDVALFAVDALTTSALLQRTVELGGPGNFTDDDVARLYARMANRNVRIIHVPRKAAVLLSGALRPLHAGVARVLRMASLSEDEHPEAFDSTGLTREFAVRLTPLDEFVRARVMD